MITLTDRLRKLVNPRPRGKGRLAPADNFGALLGGRGVGVPISTDTAGGGITPPLIEVAGTRVYYGEKSYTSSDGFFIIVNQAIETTIFIDGAGNAIPVFYEEE